MRKILAILLAAVLCCGSAMCEADYKQSMDEYEPLCELAENYGFKLGICMSYSSLLDKPYLNLISGHFNTTTATNEMKAYSLLDQRASQKSEDGMPRMNYRQADGMVGWAQKNDVGVRGHVLVWDAYMTDWFFHEDYDSRKPFVDQETMRLRLKSYIEQVITHFEENYPGVVYCWDVVNEAVGDSAADYDASDARHIRTVRGGTANVFYERVGTDYVEYAFMCAKDTVEAHGYATKLFYNDYNLFYAEKRTAVIALVNSINSYAVDENGEYRTLVDGIGMQGYIGGYGYQEGCMNDNDIKSIRTSILAYTKLGVEVQITEMAVRNFDGTQIDKHAAFYAKLFEMFTTVNSEGGNLTGVTIWGVTDNPTLKPGNYVYSMNGTHSGIVTEKYAPKLATELVYRVLKGEN